MRLLHKDQHRAGFFGGAVAANLHAEIMGGEHPVIAAERAYEKGMPSGRIIDALSTERREFARGRSQTDRNVVEDIDTAIVNLKRGFPPAGEPISLQA